jgi:spermidine/putrescine transport system substrate-binding protein
MTSSDEFPIRVHIASSSGLGRRVSRRTVLKGGAAAAFLMGLPTIAACGSDDGETEEGGKGTAGLKVYGFDSIISKESLNKMSVELVPFSTTDEGLARLQTGSDGLDLMVIDSAYAKGAIDQGLFQPLPKDRLKNFGNLDPLAKGQAWDPEEKFTFVKGYAMVGWAFNRSDFPDGVGSTWGEVFEAIKGPASKKFVTYPDGGLLAVTYFLANGIDPSSPTDEQIDEAERYWAEELAPHILEFPPLPESAVSQGTANLMMVASGYLRPALLDSGDPEAWGFQATQALRFVDVWGILAGAERVDGALEFLDYMLTPEAAVTEMLAVGVSIPVKGAELPADTELKELVIRPEAEVATAVSMAFGDKTARYSALFEAVQTAAAS